MMEEFPSNSHRPVEGNEKKEGEEQHVELEPIVGVNNVIRRKKPLGRRFMDTFFRGDSNGLIGYLINEVLVPAAQDMLIDAVKQGIERAVYGEVRSPTPRANRSSSVNRPIISYNDQYSSRPRPAASPLLPGRRPAITSRPSFFDNREVIFESRAHVEDVVQKLDETIRKYGSVTVANLNELTHYTSSYTDHNWGWTDLRGLDIKRIREGYLLLLPDPEDLRQ